MTGDEAKARWICCPLCVKKICERGADDCDVKRYLKKKVESEDKANGEVLHDFGGTYNYGGDVRCADLMCM